MTAAVEIMEVLTATEEWLDTDRLAEATGYTPGTIRIEMAGLVAQGKVERQLSPDHTGYVYKATA